MSAEEPRNASAVPSATRISLEDSAALHDPGAVGLLPPVTGGAAGALDSSAGAIRRENLRLLVRSPAFLIGAAILLWWIVCALFGTEFAPYNPVAGTLTAFNNPPSGAHWFGTDSLGRDVFSRVIVGARDSAPCWVPASAWCRATSSVRWTASSAGSWTPCSLSRS